MKRSQVVVILIGTAIVVLGGAVIFAGNDKNAMPPSNMSGQSNMDVAKPGPNEVLIQGFEFNDSKLTIKKGTTITWVNKDDAHHDISPLKPSDDFKASKLLARGESYSFTFNTPGTYDYKCSPHPYMKATIEVTE